MPAQTAMPLANDPNMMARLPIAGAQEIRTDWPRTIGGVVSDAPSKGAIAPAQASTAIRGDNLEITAADGAAAMPLPAPSSRDVSAAAEHPAGAALPDAPAFGIAALPATAENAPPARLIASAHVMSPPATVSGRPDAIGREMGVAIARHVDAGADAMTIRLDPIELGRIEVRMSFDQDGNLRTVMRAENPVALGLLRDDSAALGSALTKAGIQSDAQSFQFDSRSSGGGHNGQSSRQPHDPNPRWSASAYPDQETGPHQYRPFRTAANLDLIA